MREHARSIAPASEIPTDRVGPYIISNQSIGEGIGGPVKLAHNIFNSDRAAAKTVNKSISQKLKEGRKEIRILQNCEHPNIIKLQHVEETPYLLFIFTEYCECGDIWNYMQTRGYFEENAAKYIFRQMVEAVDYCHKKQRICHHDIKLENYVMDSSQRVKLIDFGFAIDLQETGGKNSIKVFDSSPAYSPLEILTRRPHDETVDIFSLGICLHFMLNGAFPFCESDKTSFEELCENVQMNNVEFAEYLSPTVKELIMRMLARKKCRITIEEIKAHRWFL